MLLFKGWSSIEMEVTHEKIWAKISQKNCEFSKFFKNFSRFQKIFGQKRLPFRQFLIFIGLVFCKQFHFDSI